MYKNILMLVSLTFVSGVAYAADPLEAAPGMYKKLFENDRVRVMEVTFKPGEKIKEHSQGNPSRVVFITPAPSSREEQVFCIFDFRSRASLPAFLRISVAWGDRTILYSREIAAGTRGSPFYVGGPNVRAEIGRR